MNPEERKALMHFLELGYSNHQAAELMSFKFGKFFSPRDISLEKYYRLPRIRPWTPPLYECPRLPDGDYMICSDIHAPFHSEVWVDRYLEIARKKKIKKQIIVGDLFEFSALSSFLPIEGETGEGFSKELEACEKLIEKFARVFQVSYLVSGNHERRVFRASDGNIPAAVIYRYFKDFDRFVVTPFDKVEIGDNWLLVHPKNYSQISGNVAFRLAAKYRKNIINAHGHFVALRYDASGQNMVVDLGGLFDTRKIDYINLQTTTHPFWNNGFGCLQRGKFYLYHKGSDWEGVKKKIKKAMF